MCIRDRFYEDDAGEAKEAIGLARKLVQMDKVVAVVGGSYSMPTRAVAPLFQEFEIPLVAGYAVHPDITAAGDFCFRNGFLGTVEGRGAGVAAVDMLKAKTVGMLTMDNDFGRQMAEGFKSYVVSKGDVYKRQGIGIRGFFLGDDLNQWGGICSY